ncbi:MAG: hypothetical protein RJB66_1585 [Pseudomonadota bacterium]|jgi:long-chain acyl-CoA synthetase
MTRIWLKEYQQGVPSDINPDLYNSIPEILTPSFKKYASHPSFTSFGTTFTYEKIHTQALKFAAFLQKDLGHKPGDRIALMMPNVLQYPICIFGALYAGMTIVNVNPLYTGRELQYQLKDSGAETIVIFANAAATLQTIVKDTPIKNIITTEIGDLLNFPKNILINFVLKHVKKMVPAYSLANEISIQTAFESRTTQDFTPVTIKNTDIAFLQYTGGTTGVSKGAILTHRNMISNLLQAKAWLDPVIEDGKEVIITALPLYHIFSLTANCFTFSFVGGHNIMITNPKDIPGFIKELSRWKFSTITGVNTLFRALMNDPKFSQLDFSKLKISLGGGMAVQKAVAVEWKQKTGTPLIEAYGLTETSPAACINPLNIPEFNGCIGVPISSTEVKILDDNGNELPIGESGEICIRGPQVMAGYWKKPEETEKVMTRDAFFKSGDIGFMNEKGFVKIMDRKKDMILVSGFNVYPNEIEDLLATHPKVLEVAAIGVADEKSGEVVKVFVVKRDSSLTDDELIRFSRENLVGYKVPKSVEFRDSLPKSNVGKILRKDLRDGAK